MNRQPWPQWSGVAVCIASGPSLTAEQIARVYAEPVRPKTIAINDVGLEERAPICAPWADIHYAADLNFWHHYRERSIGGFKLERRKFAGLTVTADREPLERGYVDCALELTYDAHAFDIPGRVKRGTHSGFQAVQLAVTLGATRILLLGFDCKNAGPKTNYFGRKPAHLDRPSPLHYWPRDYSSVQWPAGVEIINCTPGSAITKFPFQTIDEALSNG